MRAPLSIVIPTLNAAAHLPETLACLVEGLDRGLVRELIVADGGSTDQTAQIAEDAGARLVSGTAGRGGQLRRGCAAAQGAWLLILHADTHLSAGWSEAVLHHLNSPDKAGYFRLKFRATGLAPAMIAAGANLRARLGLPYGDQGLLISADRYQKSGGYADIALMEDVLMARALRGDLVFLAASAETDPERYLRNGWFTQVARNQWTLGKYLWGVAPANLAKSYRR